MSYKDEDDAPRKLYVERADYRERDIPVPSSSRQPPAAYSNAPEGSGPQSYRPEIRHVEPGPRRPPPMPMPRFGGVEPVILHTAPGPNTRSSSPPEPRIIRPPSPPIIEVPPRVVHRHGDPPRPPPVRPPQREHPIRPPPRRPSPSRPAPRRRSPRPVPEGFVTPAPPLNHPEKAGGGHDLDTLTGGNPKDSPKVRDNLVLCVYRNSKQTYDFRYVELRRDHKLSSSEKPNISDRELFRNMRNTYHTQLRGWPRRIFSFKALTTIKLLNYGHDQFFRPAQDDDLFALRFMKVWRNPNEQLPRHSDEWVQWILGAKRLYEDFDSAIELVEDYVPERIVLFVGFGLLGIVALTAAWLVKGGDPTNVSTVMSFVLGFVAAVVALTGIWDFFDGGRSDEIRKHAAVTWPDGAPPENFNTIPSAPRGRKS